MSFCKAEEDKAVVGDKTVIFCVDPSTQNIIYAIDGQDNKNYYSFNGVKDGVVAYPEHMNFFDMWFTQSHSLPEIKSFLKLVEAGKECFEHKNDELVDKYEKWGKKSILGKIGSDRRSMAILGQDKDLIAKALSFFSNLGLVIPYTDVYINRKFEGEVKALTHKEESKIMIPGDSLIARAQLDVSETPPSDTNQHVTETETSKEDPEVLNLIQKYKESHDSDAAEKLIDKYDKLIRSLLSRYSRLYKITPDKKEDILQESYVKFLTQLSEYDPSKGKLSTYVYNTIDGLISNSVTRKTKIDQNTQNMSVTEDDETGLDPSKMEQNREPTPEHNEMLTDLKTMLDSLPDNQKDIINQYFYSGKTLEQIGDEKNLSKERIRQVVEQSLETLRTRFSDSSPVEAIRVADLSSYEDKDIYDLVNKYKNTKDRDTAEQLINKYDKLIHSILHKYSRRYNIPQDKSDDILQESYLKFLEKLYDYNPEMGKLSTYAYSTIDGLVRNSVTRKTELDKHTLRLMPEVSLDDMHRRKSPSDLSPPAIEQYREPTPEQNDLSNDLKDSVRKLKDPEKSIVESYFFGGKTLEDIGRDIGVSKQRIQQVLSNAIDELKRLLHGYDPVEAMKIAMIFSKTPKTLVLSCRN